MFVKEFFVWKCLSSSDCKRIELSQVFNLKMQTYRYTISDWNRSSHLWLHLFKKKSLDRCLWKIFTIIVSFTSLKIFSFLIIFSKTRFGFDRRNGLSFVWWSDSFNIGSYLKKKQIERKNTEKTTKRKRKQRQRNIRTQTYTISHQYIFLLFRSFFIEIDK